MLISNLPKIQFENSWYPRGEGGGAGSKLLEKMKQKGWFCFFENKRAYERLRHIERERERERERMRERERKRYNEREGEKEIDR